MAKRHRTRPRTRGSGESAHRAAVPRVDREAPPVTRPAAHRTVVRSRTGYSRALGAPSASLERAAVLERNFIGKDFRRLAIVVGVALVLLIAAGAVESVLLR
ncbi:MAG TPA: hypothetical protein VGK15_05825 [Candidatus Limnocylindria bacterium]|jgi:hypothetical protein